MMKKMKKISKIFLVLTIIFSQLSSVVTVLAEEIITKPLVTTLNAVIDEDFGYVEKYNFTYISEKNDYEDEKEYTIELKSSFTYLNGETENSELEKITKSGAEINNKRNEYELDPISTYYNGIYNLEITVKDSASIIYEANIPYTVDTVKSGLIGALNNGDVLPAEEIVGTTSTGKYSVSEEKNYTQSLMIIPGELSPNSNYIVKQGETEVYKGTGKNMFGKVFSGSSIDTTGLLGGLYNLNNAITIEEIDENEEVVNTIDYVYDASISYDKNNNDLFKDIYGLDFRDGYLYENAVGYNDGEKVSSIEDITSGLVNTDIEITIYDEENNQLDLTNEEILKNEIKNNYKIVFKKGAEVVYTVVIMGDNSNDNRFTTDDMKPTMEDYLEENKVISMDVVRDNDDEIGKLGFNDIMAINTLLESELPRYTLNEDLSLVFGEVPEEIFVGDVFKLDVLVNANNIDDYINGINGVISTDSDLKLTNIIFNDKLIGAYKDSDLVAAGNHLLNGDTVMTLEFTAVAEGESTISLTGEIAKYDIINEFEEITKTISITRNISSNNNLSSLNASIGTFDIAFDKDVTVYTLTVPYDTESVILSGGLEDINSTVTGLIEYTLDEDKTIANITVTAEDGSIKVYTVYIIKDAKPIEVVTPVTYYYSSNNYLKSLEIDGYEIEFDRETLEYKIKVKSDVTTLDITAIPESNKARVEITGNEKFVKGDNTVTITVTAEDGSVREYKLIVNKDAEKKDALTEIEDSSNTAEKIVIIILIILVVLGLLYLIFKKDDEPEITSVELKKNNNSKETKNKVDTKKDINKKKK